MEKKGNDGRNERRRGIKWQRNRGRKELTGWRGFARHEKGVCCGALMSLGKLEDFYGLL